MTELAPSLLMLTMRILFSRNLWISLIFSGPIGPVVLSLHMNPAFRGNTENNQGGTHV
jgi:hypothetical protein